jgi:hypothetical protein
MPMVIDYEKCFWPEAAFTHFSKHSELFCFDKVFHSYLE